MHEYFKQKQDHGQEFCLNQSLELDVDRFNVQ